MNLSGPMTQKFELPEQPGALLLGRFLPLVIVLFVQLWVCNFCFKSEFHSLEPKRKRNLFFFVLAL